MANEHDLIRDASKGVRSRQLLEDELLVDAFKTLENAYTLAWRRTYIDDTAAREKLFLAINVVGLVRDHLAAAVTNGKFAEAQLKTIEHMRQRKKHWHEVR